MTDDNPLPSELVEFRAKLDKKIDGETPVLTEDERRWYRVFRDVSRRFDSISTERSFEVSFGALHRCWKRGKSGFENYLHEACRKAHLKFLEKRRQRRRVERKLATERRWAEHDWAAIDRRIDMDEAVATLSEMQQKALKLRRQGKKLKYISDNLGVCQRQLRRWFDEANALIREKMRSYDE